MQHEVNSGTPLLRAEGLFMILRTAKGRGVFASQPIFAGTVIEVCPVLIFGTEEMTNHVSKTCINDYTYYWPSTDGRTLLQALALGLGSMFNHSKRQNVLWTRDIDTDCITYTASRDVEKGEELCISYGSQQLWFEDTEEPDGKQEKGQSEDNCDEEYDPGQTLGELELSGLGRMALDLD